LLWLDIAHRNRKRLLRYVSRIAVDGICEIQQYRVIERILELLFEVRRIVAMQVTRILESVD